MNQDTGKFRTNNKDQFYTKPDIAKMCIAKILTIIPDINKYVWIEPSAGNGSFFNNIPNGIDKIGIDIEPKTKDVLKEDFLTWNQPFKDNKIIVVGNPPFGRQSSLAKAFIKKSCKFADIIAFILPRSFMKPSNSNAFSSKFHCIFTIELEKNSFEINGKPYNVNCIFQIYQKQLTDRIILDKMQPIGFKYTKSDKPFDLVIKRVGGRAGTAYSPQSNVFNNNTHYFLKFDKFPIDIIEKLNNHVFPSNTVGPRSLSKSEVNEVINKLSMK